MPPTSSSSKSGKPRPAHSGEHSVQGLSATRQQLVSDADNNGVTALVQDRKEMRERPRLHRKAGVSQLNSNRPPRMSVQVFTPILEEPPEHQGGHASSSTPSPAGPAPPPLPPSRPTPVEQSNGGFRYFKDVVEAQARGDIEAASAAFKAINTQLGSLPRDSPEKAEIFAECGLHLLLEARRCKSQQQLDDARTKAQRAVDCLETSIKLQRTLGFPVRTHHYLWSGWISEFLNRKAEAHKAYENGIAAASDPTDGVVFELWMARIELCTEDQNWERCWSILMTMLTIWPQVPDLYARAGVVVLKKDHARSPLEALQGSLFWYRAATELAPTNTYYPLCIARISEQLAISLPHPPLSAEPPAPSFSPPPPPPPGNFIDMRSRTSLDTTHSEYGEVLPPSERQFVGMTGEHAPLAPMSPLPPPTRPQASQTRVRSRTSLDTTHSEYGEVLPPSERQFVGMTGEHAPLAPMSPLPPPTRPQSVGPLLQPFPGDSVPKAPEAWQLPSPSLRSRSVVSSPGPSSQQSRRFSGSHRTKGLLSRVHDAVKSIHEVARAVTPLKERVRETQEALTQQYGHLHERVDDLSHQQVTLQKDLSRRISNAEINIDDLRAARSSFEQEDYARRAQSVPPQRFNAANLSQDELLERSIMLYGVWALEKRLAT